MFVFTSLMGYYYQAEFNVHYLVKINIAAAWVMRVVFIASAFSGVLVNGEIIRTMGDTGYSPIPDQLQIMMHVAGHVAAGVIPGRISHADFVISSTTKTFGSAGSGMVFCKAEHLLAVYELCRTRQSPGDQ